MKDATMAVQVTGAVTAMVPVVATIATTGIEATVAERQKQRWWWGRQPQTNSTTRRMAVVIGAMVNRGSWRVPGNAQGRNNKKQGKQPRPRSCHHICCQSLGIPNFLDLCKSCSVCHKTAKNVAS